MEAKTVVPLRDLGEIKPEWNGIRSPVYDDELINQFIHGTFLEDASTYAARYQDTSYWCSLLRFAQAQVAFPEPMMHILDIGSGAGNSVIPLLELYPHAHLIASDLSVPLLKILKDYLAQEHPNNCISIMQLNAEQLIFADEQFDLVCGGSILHHLFHPEKTVTECHRVLKPGGVAVFFEPFLIGNLVLSLALKQLLRTNRTLPTGANPLRADLVRFFEGMCCDFDVRKKNEKIPLELRQRLEDKWLFTEHYFRSLAETAGFKQPVIRSINTTQRLYRSEVQVLLQLGLGIQDGLKLLPQWAQEQLAELDDHFTAEALEELRFSGCVCFVKPARSAVARAA